MFLPHVNDSAISFPFAELWSLRTRYGDRKYGTERIETTRTEAERITVQLLDKSDAFIALNLCSSLGSKADVASTTRATAVISQLSSGYKRVYRAQINAGEQERINSGLIPIPGGGIHTDLKYQDVISHPT